MADKELLSREEIDALLSGVSEGAVDTEDSFDLSGAEVRPYDLTSQDRIVRGRLPIVEMIGERFARQLRGSLQTNLRFPIDVVSSGVQVLKFSEYVSTLFVPTFTKIVRVQPFGGQSLIALDAKLVFRLVDRFFGGNGKAAGADTRDFTPTERRVVRRVLDLAFVELAAAWNDVLPVQIEPIAEEINPALINGFTQSDVLMVTSYQVELQDGGGDLHVALPYDALEPYRSLLDAAGRSDELEQDESWTPNVERALLDSTVPLSCRIAEAEVKLRELLRLQVNDVIDIDVPELHVVRAAGVPSFLAKMGDSRGKLALEFERFVD